MKEKMKDIKTTYTLEYEGRYYFDATTTQTNLHCVMLPSFRISSIMEVMSGKASLGDTMIICSVLENINRIDCLVSWNANHFAGKIPKPTFTPAEYLKRF